MFLFFYLLSVFHEADCAKAHCIDIKRHFKGVTSSVFLCRLSFIIYFYPVIARVYIFLFNWKIQCNACTGVSPLPCPWRALACHSRAPEVLGLWVRIQTCPFSPASHQFGSLFCPKQCKKQNSTITPFFKSCFFLLQWWLWSVLVRCNLRAVTVRVSSPGRSLGLSPTAGGDSCAQEV